MKKAVDSEAVRTKEAAGVAVYMKKLEHPLKAEVETLRQIITGTSKKLSERIKWNGPSYYYKEDLLTFSLHAKERICLVFHHKRIVSITSPLLLGNYPDRRLMYFASMSDVKKSQKELKRILKELITAVER